MTEVNRAICGKMCPGCQYGLPEVRICDKEEWEHALPGTNFVIRCKATEYRNAAASLPVRGMSLCPKCGSWPCEC